MTSLNTVANFSGITAQRTFTAGTGGLSILRNSEPPDGSIPPKAPIDIEQAIRDANTRAQVTTLLSRASGVLDSIRQGKTTAQHDYEKIGAGLQAAGQPIDIRLGEKGDIIVEPLGRTTNPDVTSAQKKIINSNLARIEELIGIDRLVDTREGLRTSLRNIVNRLDFLRSSGLPRDQNEFDLQGLILSGKPAQIQFNQDGNLFIIDQIENVTIGQDPVAQQAFYEAEEEFRALLSRRDTLAADLITTDFTYTDSSGTQQSFTIQPWHRQVSNYIIAFPARPYTLRYDSVLAEITAEPLTYDNQLPEFLQKRNDVPAKAITQLEKDVLRFASNREAYTLIVSGTSVRAVGLTQHLLQQIGSADEQSTRALIEARRSLLA
ncbi:MAG: hypothetical protein AAF352_01040 [Pseudomonadota bacterium]